MRPSSRISRASSRLLAVLAALGIFLGLYLSSHSYPLIHKLAEMFSVAVAVAIFILARRLKQSEDALRSLNEQLEQRVGERTTELEAANRELKKEIEERSRIESNILAGNALLNLLGRKTSRREYLDEVVRLITEWSGCRYAGIRILLEDGQIPYESRVGYDGGFLRSEDLLSADSDQCICTRIIKGIPDLQDRRAMTAFGSFRTDNLLGFFSGLSERERTRYRSDCMRQGFRSLAVVPIRRDEKIVAEVHLADEREGRITESSVELLESVTPLIGEAIYKLDMEAQRARLAAAIESTAEAIAITDRTGFILYVNPAFEHITGYRRAEAVGKELHLLDSGQHDEALFRTIREALEQGGIWSGPMVNRKKDGTLYHAECTISPVKDALGEIINFVFVKRDVTEKLRLESIADAVNTMSNIGYIFSGVRHELGNPVNSIKTTLGMLRANMERFEKSSIKEYIERSLGELSRVEYLLGSLKNFNMYENPEIRTIPLAPFTDALISLVKEDFSKKGLGISVSLASDAERCRADSRALEQVLLNVLTNASDACEGLEGAEITLAIMRESDLIRIRVTDNGRGMTEEEQKNLFRPFHTTKPSGTGLGLVIAKKMLAKMNGAIALTSIKDEGTTVDILIPAHIPGGTDDR